MKFVFLGTSQFSAVILQILLDHKFAPDLVVCNPDRPAGRKKNLSPPPVKPIAQKSGIRLIQPEKLDESAREVLEQGSYDFFVLASYGKILSNQILKIPRLGTIGVHVSLLPKYRGAAPMQRAILDGESETGVTLYLMDEQVDHGPIITRKKFPLRGQTYLELQDESARAGAELLIATLPLFVKGQIPPHAQNDAQATFAPKPEAEEGFVSPQDLRLALSGENPGQAERIWRKIRALNPEPGVWTLAQALDKYRPGKVPPNERAKLLSASLEGGRLILHLVQFSGRSPQSLL